MDEDILEAVALELTEKKTGESDKPPPGLSAAKVSIFDGLSYILSP